MCCILQSESGSTESRSATDKDGQLFDLVKENNDILKGMHFQGKSQKEKSYCQDDSSYSMVNIDNVLVLKCMYIYK